MNNQREISRSGGKKTVLANIELKILYLRHLSRGSRKSLSTLSEKMILGQVRIGESPPSSAALRHLFLHPLLQHLSGQRPIWRQEQVS